MPINPDYINTAFQRYLDRVPTLRTLIGTSPNEVRIFRDALARSIISGNYLQVFSECIHIHLYWRFFYYSPMSARASSFVRAGTEQVMALGARGLSYVSSQITTRIWGAPASPEFATLESVPSQDSLEAQEATSRIDLFNALIEYYIQNERTSFISLILTPTFYTFYETIAQLHHSGVYHALNEAAHLPPSMSSLILAEISRRPQIKGIDS